jgi:hypothetical protein
MNTVITAAAAVVEGAVVGFVGTLVVVNTLFSMFGDRR